MRGGAGGPRSPREEGVRGGSGGPRSPRKTDAIFMIATCYEV